MNMLGTPEIVAARLVDWRKLGQGLHARWRTPGFAAGVAFLADVAAAGEELGHQPRATLGDTWVDLVLISTDAIYREDDGTEHVVDWTTTADLELARRSSPLAEQHGLRAAVEEVVAVELYLRVRDEARVAPFWSALLTGGDEAQGRGTLDQSIRDLTRRVPLVSFPEVDPAALDPGPGDGPGRWHVEVQLPHEVGRERVELALAAGGTLLDGARAPQEWTLADPEGNTAAVEVYQQPGA